MEEESLLKERLQAITDKRRIREDISHKRRDIEEEKLKLQYIKKKSLREQWLMDGLQSEEEREAMKIQAQDELERTTQLQSNILKMEKEMEELEEQELDLSAKEENILKRLKEVERTTEDIIKELNEDPLSDVSWSSPLTEDSLSDIFIEPPPLYPQVSSDHGPSEDKRATFAMEISVELDKRTGKTQVISTASITPDMIQEKGLKVYEDTRKSVYALSPGGGSGEVSAMTHTDVDELLRQATDWSGDIQYHQPVYAAPFTGSSRPSTPGTFKTTNTASPSLGHGKSTRTPNPASSRTGSRLEVYSELEEGNNHLISSSNMQAVDDMNDSPYAILGSFKTCSNASTSSTRQVSKNIESSPQHARHRYELDFPAKSMNLDKTSMNKIGQSETPSPTFSRSESGIEEYQEGSDISPSKSPPNFQTLHCINDFSDLVSEEILTTTMPPYDDHGSRSLLTTHRYELDLIRRSMSKSPTNLTNQNEMTIGRSRIEIENDMTPALASASVRFEGLPTTTKPVQKNTETKHELDVTQRSSNLHGTLKIKTNDFSQSKTTSPAPSEKEVGSNQIPTRNSMTKQDIDNQKAAVVLVRASSDGMPTQLIYKNIEKSPSPQNYHLDTNESNLDRISPSYPESLASSLLEELDPGAVTMVFMGYENVDGDEEEPIEAEVVVIGNSDEEDMNEEDDLSIYHPNGYTSKVFQPVVGVAKVMDGRGFDEEMHWRESLPHKPTFRAGKNTPCQKEGRLQGSDKESVMER
ncbi:palmdelphin isoform X2 [Periophthalmus magnuspinnatus]|uniref:palmdelphin isoform X2 n=1 Tax=Periophthalmus magnuspinnatus TaxID=409849 RepID=UPI00145AFD5D|nr:palmdelphin isoform X2 [Periophthalmus magnuspinnatus]